MPFPLHALQIHASKHRYPLKSVFELHYSSFCFPIQCQVGYVYSSSLQFTYTRCRIAKVYEVAHLLVETVTGFFSFLFLFFFLVLMNDKIPSAEHLYLTIL